MPVEAGELLAGKYRVEKVLGEGGMGVVVAARHEQLGQRVAVKFMLPAALHSEGAADRFLREARAAVRLRSEHVAKVLDVGTLDSGAPYMVMEFLEGRDLSDLLETQGRLAGTMAVDFLIQACAAMADAHAQGVIHRDLKPANLFVTTRPDGRPMIKVLDFGISKLLDGTTDLAATKTGMAMGSPAYMAPEQMRSAKHADARADIWSLGAILYHLLSGRLPYLADTFTEMMARVLTEDVAPIAQLVPDIPPDLATIVHGCLTRDVERRIPSVVALARALAPFGSQEGRLIGLSLAGPPATVEPLAPTRLPSPAGATAVPAVSTSVGASYAAGEARARPRERRWIALTGLAIAVAAGGGALIATQPWHDTPAPTPAAAAAPGDGLAVPPVPDPSPVASRDAAPPPIDAAPPDAAPPDAAPIDAAPTHRRGRKKRHRRDDDVFGHMY